MPNPDDVSANTVDLIRMLEQALALEAPDNRPRELREFIKRQKESGTSDREIELLMAAHSVFHLGLEAGREVGATTVDNSVNIQGSTVSAGNVGNSNSLTARDFSLVQNVISNGMASPELKAALSEALECLANWKPSDEREKSDVAEAFNKVAQEISGESPHIPRLQKLWQSFLALGEGVMKFKPFVELGLLLSKHFSL